MERDIAQAVAIGIATVLFIVWLAALRFMLHATRERQAQADDASQAIGTVNPRGTIVGSAEVAGQPDVLAAKLLERLAHDALGFLGPIKITSADRREVRFEAIGSAPGTPGYTSGRIRRGSIQFTGAGNKTLIEYRVEAGPARVLLGLGWLFIALGLAALVVGLCLEFTLVIPSPQTAVRAQAVQMIQAGHLIWPPFLFAQVAWPPVRLIRDQLEALINNLPYC